MTELFNRDMVITAGPIEIPIRTKDAKPDRIRPNLRVTFSVEKTGDPSPNTGAFTIYNLNEDHRKALEKGQPVRIQAGYVGTLQQIFRGTIKAPDSRREGPNWLTSFEAEDGGDRYTTARVSKSFGPGATLKAILEALADSLGVGLGNSTLKFSASPRGLQSFKAGVVLTGKATVALDKYVTSAGYRWSIQDEQLQILGPDETILGEKIVLSVTSGLVGSPEKLDKGRVKALSLLQGSLIPGRLVEVQSEQIDKGTFKVEKCTHFGDTWGRDWYTEIEAKET